MNCWSVTSLAANTQRAPITMNAQSLKNTESTREQLLDAAEKLFVEQGLDTVSVRAILREAGQRNQSALQYHFGSRDGLINALVDRRMSQLEARRSALVDEAIAQNPDPDLRECCALQARAPFLLCREDQEFRDFFGLFGQRLLTSNLAITTFVEERRTPSLTTVWNALWNHLSYLDPAVLQLRIETTFGMSLLAISRRARRKASFRGQSAELFFENIVDQIAAMLAAPVSDATQAALDAHKSQSDGKP